MIGRVLYALVLMIGTSLSAQAVHQVDVNRHRHVAKSSLVDANSGSSQDEGADEHADEHEDEDEDDDSNDDEDGPSESDHDPNDTDDGDSLSETDARRQTPTVQNNWDLASAKQRDEGLVTFRSTRPIRVHWLWHQSMCVAADMTKNVHHTRNIHIEECEDPTPSRQRFDYFPDTYQIKLHYDQGQYCLDRDGDNLIFNLCKTGDYGSQRFVFDAGTDHIRNAASGGGVKCLEINAGEAKLGDLYVNGTNINLASCIASETNQKFKPANLIDFNLTTTGQTVAAETPASAAQQKQQPKPKETMPQIVPQSMPQYSQYYSMMPQMMPPYYTQPQMVGYPRYPQYQNPMNPVMPAAMPQMMAQGAMGATPMIRETKAASPHVVASTATAQRGGPQAAAALSKKHQIEASPSLVSKAHATAPHAQARSPMQDAADIAASKATLKKATDILSPSSSIDAIDAAGNADHLPNEDVLNTKTVGESSSLDPLSHDDSATSSGGDSMFRDLEDILGHGKKANEGDDVALSPQAPASSEADNALSRASGLQQEPSLPEVPIPTTDASNPQMSSINDILGDLTEAGKDMAVIDKPTKDKASLQDDTLSPGSLLETTLEVGPGGALLRRSE